MVTKMHGSEEEGGRSEDPSDLAGTVRESAQQIWLAGLGAFSRAQQEGGKVFQALVKEGVNLQRKTQDTAGEKLNEATSRMASMASELSNRASGQWDKLENLFEERVARALKKMGVPSAGDVAELAARIEELERTVAALRAGPVTRTTARSAAKAPAQRRVAKRPAVKAARKRSTARKAGGD